MKLLNQMFNDLFVYSPEGTDPVDEDINEYYVLDGNVLRHVKRYDFFTLTFLDGPIPDGKLELKKKIDKDELVHFQSHCKQFFNAHRIRPYAYLLFQPTTGNQEIALLVPVQELQNVSYKISTKIQNRLDRGWVIIGDIRYEDKALPIIGNLLNFTYSHPDIGDCLHIHLKPEMTDTVYTFGNNIPVDEFDFVDNRADLHASWAGQGDIEHNNMVIPKIDSKQVLKNAEDFGKKAYEFGTEVYETGKKTVEKYGPKVVKGAKTVADFVLKKIKDKLPKDDEEPKK